jgi:hypothetical protein
MVLSQLQMGLLGTKEAGSWHWAVSKLEVGRPWETEGVKPTMVMQDRMLNLMAMTATKMKMLMMISCTIT